MTCCFTGQCLFCWKILRQGRSFSENADSSRMRLYLCQCLSDISVFVTSKPFIVRLFFSEVIISPTFIQPSLNEVILVCRPLLLRILSVFSSATRSIKNWSCSVFFVAALVSMPTSSQDRTSCITNEVKVLMSPSISWHASLCLFTSSTFLKILFCSLSTWKVTGYSITLWKAA